MAKTISILSEWCKKGFSDREFPLTAYVMYLCYFGASKIKYEIC